MRSYLLLLLIGLLWGSQFLFMHHAAELQPIVLATARSLCGFLTLGLTCAILRLKSEHTPLRTYMLLALVDATIPFVFIAWGQSRVDSAIASVLMGAIPFVTIMLTPLMVPGSKISKGDFASVILGFIGVLVLFWPQLQSGGSSGILGSAAILFGASCFALGLQLIKKLAKDHPVVVARNIVGSSFVQLAVIVPLMTNWSMVSMPSMQAVGGVALLGILSTGFVYFLYMVLINLAGPGFASFSNYLVPLFGVLIGAYFLGEDISPTTVYALVLILGSVALHQFNQQRKKVNLAQKDLELAS